MSDITNESKQIPDQIYNVLFLSRWFSLELLKIYTFRVRIDLI